MFSDPHPPDLRLDDVEVRWHDGGDMGRSLHADRAITFRRDLTPEEMRCTAEHECQHIENGPVPNGLKAKEEERVRRDTAFRLIPDMRPIGDAIAWALSEEEAALELGVDIYVLRYRLHHMSPMERSWLLHRLQRDDVVEP